MRTGMYTMSYLYLINTKWHCSVVLEAPTGQRSHPYYSRIIKYISTPPFRHEECISWTQFIGS